jgi:hypothetical protein
MPAAARRLRHARLSGLVLLALTVAGGASTARAADLSGCWDGYWQSCSSGHQGPLSATFCRTDPNHYQVTFTGRFFRFIPFRYTVTLSVLADDGQTVTLGGSHDLGRLAGTFTYRATATSTNFTANYYSCKDQGKFVLSRCAPACSN